MAIFQAFHWNFSLSTSHKPWNREEWSEYEKKTGWNFKTGLTTYLLMLWLIQKQRSLNFIFFKTKDNMVNFWIEKEKIMLFLFPLLFLCFSQAIIRMGHKLFVSFGGIHKPRSHQGGRGVENFPKLATS